MRQTDILRAWAPHAESYLEVGVQEGRSLRTVLEANPRIARLVLCDTWGRRSGGTGRGSHAHIAMLLAGLCYGGQVIFLDGRSQETLPAFFAGQPWQVDLAHVDGEHTEDGAAMDLRHLWPFVARALVVHDITIPSVWRAVCAFMREPTVAAATASVAFGGHGTMVIQRCAS